MTTPGRADKERPNGTAAGGGEGGGGGGGHRYSRPRSILIAAGVLIAVYALLLPQLVNGRSGDSRLTTYSAQPQGARLLYELADRLGWTVSRRTVPTIPADSTTIMAVLAPVRPLRRGEIHALLQRVRGGAALLLTLPDDPGAFTDSLHFFAGAGALLHLPSERTRDSCPAASGVTAPFWYRDQVTMYSLRWNAPPPPGLVAFAHVTTTGKDTVTRPAVVGFPYGRGRVVVVSDPDFLRNDAVRECRYGLSVLAVQELEYLRGGGAVPRTRLVFDEYHQGYGAQPGTVSAIGEFFARTTAGHFLLQLLGAGLLLLLAAAPRTLAPYDAPRVQRRSPLEHVDALARAYAQVGGTRTAVARLVRGVRRRIGLAAARATAGRSDDEFLSWVEATDPAVAADATRVRTALRTPVGLHELTAVGQSLAHIESSLTNRGS
jgi:Domain of unknown function (DUF4350)